MMPEHHPFGLGNTLGEGESGFLSIFVFPWQALKGYSVMQPRRIFPSFKKGSLDTAN